MMMAGALFLMTGCSAEDVVKETTSEGAIAISFSCNYDDEEEGNMTRAGHQGVMNTEDLYATGFGVMASLTAGDAPDYDNIPSLMYNQKVKFTFVGDMADPLKGFWSYQPVKYWPTDLSHCYISAYAPYVEPPIADAGTTTGIYGISANDVPPYVNYRRCEKPSEVVDLLWYYEKLTNIPAETAQQAAGTVAMKMHHALARLEIKLALASDPGTTKVLIEKITLTGKMAKTGQLHLYEQETETVGEGPGAVTRYYPVWSDQVFDKDGGGDDIDHTIQITNVENDAVSYGIIDSQVRYIEGLPYLWQPAGLSTALQNALSTGDRTGYVYLIPQDNLELTVKVKYHKVTSGSDVPGVKTTESTLHIPPKPSEEAPYPPLKGNTTYTLNLTLSGI